MTAPPDRLGRLVRSTPWLLEALRAARDVDPPDWLGPLRFTPRFRTPLERELVR